MKVIFFNYLTLESGGGLAKYFIETTTNLRNRYPNLDISIVTLDEKLCKKIDNLYSIYFFRKKKSIYTKNESIGEIKKSLKNVKYYKAKNLKFLKKYLQSVDLIYSKNDLLEAFILKYLIGYRALPPVIMGFHTPYYYKYTPSIHAKMHNILYGSMLYGNLLTNVKTFHVLNSSDESLLKKRFTDRRVVKIYNPYSFQKSNKQKSSYRPYMKINKDKINILWVGRITEQKGMNNLIKIIDGVNNVTRSKNKVEWHIIGDGDMKDVVLSLSKKWENVKYHGYIENKNVSYFYQNCNLFIHTSSWDALPYTLLEAQSFNLPIIAFNIPGVDEIVYNNKNGYLVSSIEQFVTRTSSFINKRAVVKPTDSNIIKRKFAKKAIYPQLYKLLVTTYE